MGGGTDGLTHRNANNSCSDLAQRLRTALKKMDRGAEAGASPNVPSTHLFQSDSSRRIQHYHAWMRAGPGLLKYIEQISCAC